MSMVLIAWGRGHTHMHTYQFSGQRQVQEITRMPGLKNGNKSSYSTLLYYFLLEYCMYIALNP